MCVVGRVVLNYNDNDDSHLFFSLSLSLSLFFQFSLQVPLPTQHQQCLHTTTSKSVVNVVAVQYFHPHPVNPKNGQKRYMYI